MILRFSVILGPNGDDDEKINPFINTHSGHADLTFLASVRVLEVVNPASVSLVLKDQYSRL